MRPDTPIYSRPPRSVRLALVLLWASLAISATNFLYSVIGPLYDPLHPGPTPRWLFVQVVVMLVMTTFLAAICVSLGRARDWARGSLVGVVLLETLVYLLILISVGSMLGPPRIPDEPAAVVAYVAFGLRVMGLLLVMVPGREWYQR
jgi:hypothetical protein